MSLISLKKATSRIGITASILVVAGASLLAVVASNPSNASASATAVSYNGVRDCDSNAVIYCGAMTAGELISKYNASASAQNIFSYFHISSADINNIGSTAVAGQVTKSGDVIVNGQTVATNAMTGGRSDIPGSTQESYGGTVFYTRQPSVSFLNNSLDAFVVMNNGQFAFAILSSCGNPIVATPVPPPTPAPKPKPSSLACTNLNVTNESDNQYEFEVTANDENVSDVSYSVDFGDQDNYTGANNQVTHTYAGPGTYTVKASVTGTLANGQSQTVTSEACSATINIPLPPPKCEVAGKTNLPANSPSCVVTTSTPPAPTPPSQLVNTGPGEIVGIFAATTIAGGLISRLFLRWRRHT